MLVVRKEDSIQTHKAPKDYFIIVISNINVIITTIVAMECLFYHSSFYHLKIQKSIVLYRRTMYHRFIVFIMMNPSIILNNFFTNLLNDHMMMIIEFGLGGGTLGKHTN